MIGCLGSLAVRTLFVINERNTAYFNTALVFSMSYLNVKISKILSKVDMFNTTLTLQNESKSTVRNQA